MEKAYWTERYSRGGTSGQGSVGMLRVMKWNIISKHVSPLDHVIDVGCGDLRFWQGKDCEDYTGIDIVESVIRANKIERPTWKFICSPAEEKIVGLSNKNVICLDVLFHIMDDDKFRMIVKNLCEYAEEMLFIYTWARNPFAPNVTDGKYQYYRDVMNEMHVFSNYGFRLLNAHWSHFDPYGCMYVFKTRSL